jgi:hypothetical protein
MGLQQRFNGLKLARARREHERRDAELIGAPDRRATRNEQLDDGPEPASAARASCAAAEFVRGGDGGGVRGAPGRSRHCRRWPPATAPRA